MLKKTITLSLALLGTASFAETATTSTTKVKAKSEKTSDKADELITNKRMRANSGSLSKYSISTSFSYSGGSLTKPFAAERPNVASAGDVVNLASMGGSISGTYRINKLNRLSLGTGLSMSAPFNTTIDTNDKGLAESFRRNQGKLNIADPYLGYSHVNNILGIQTVFSASVTEITTSSYRDFGYKNSVDAAVNTMYNFGGSRFSIGALMTVGRYYYDKKYSSEGEDLRGGQTETVWGFMPQAELVINDTFNLRTIVRSNWYENTRADSNNFKQRPITQSVGLGISVSRDLFLYPNIQFSHKNLQAKNTNIGISASINMF